MGSRTRRAIVAGCAVLALCGLGALILRTAHLWPPSIGRSAMTIGGPFTLVEGDGTAVTDRTFHGRWLLVYFGYTYCPDICPTTLNELAETLAQLGPLAGRVTPLFITVDPARDTPTVVGKYVKSFDPRIVGLTGTPEQIAAVAREYRVYYKKEPTGKGADDYLMDHSSIIYVMAPDGRYVTLFTGQQKPDQMASRLRELLTKTS
jgi:protein SCO1/2